MIREVSEWINVEYINNKKEGVVVYSRKKDRKWNVEKK